MIDTVIGAACTYDDRKVTPFLRTLRESGFGGRVILFSNGGIEESAKRWDVQLAPYPEVKTLVSMERFYWTEQLLASLSCEGVFLTDTRDVIFQKNPSEYLPSVGMNAFDEGFPIGDCVVNSDWIRTGWGEEALRSVARLSVICDGTMCGDRASMVRYLAAMCRELRAVEHRQRLVPPGKRRIMDQACHNLLFRQGGFGRVWGRDEGEVYTMTRVPFAEMHIVDWKIYNAAGNLPAVLHQCPGLPTDFPWRPIKGSLGDRPYRLWEWDRRKFWALLRHWGWET